MATVKRKPGIGSAAPPLIITKGGKVSCECCGLGCSFGVCPTVNGINSGKVGVPISLQDGLAIKAGGTLSITVLGQYATTHQANGTGGFNGFFFVAGQQYSSNLAVSANYNYSVAGCTASFSDTPATSGTTAVPWGGESLWSFSMTLRENATVSPAAFCVDTTYNLRIGDAGGYIARAQLLGDAGPGVANLSFFGTLHSRPMFIGGAGGYTAISRVANMDLTVVFSASAP